LAPLSGAAFRHLSISAFLRIAKTIYLLVFYAFRTENRCALFLEML
jgi:hypothetical protein